MDGAPQHPTDDDGDLGRGPLGRLRSWRGEAGVGLYAAVVAVVTLCAAGAVGLALHQPWLFPSLGPTVMVLAETPRQPAAHPRNVVVGHLVGAVAGYLALVVTGLTAAPSVTEAGVDGRRIAAAALSLALTTLALQVVRAPHPPAGATTLIVSLGVLPTPVDLLVVMGSVLLVTAAATALNTVAGARQAGVPRPRR